MRSADARDVAVRVLHRTRAGHVRHEPDVLIGIVLHGFGTLESDDVAHEPRFRRRAADRHAFRCAGTNTSARLPVFALALRALRHLVALGLIAARDKEGEREEEPPHW